MTSIELPNSLTTIDEAAFRECTSLTSVTLTSNLTSIEIHAFIGCSQLKEVRYNVLDDLATYIQTDHPEIVVDYDSNCDFKYYQNNQEITSLKIPAGITSIGKNVFQKYNGIQSLTFSPALTSISDLQFSCDFSNLKSVSVGWQDPIAAGNFFKNADMRKSTLYVPQGTELPYAIADVWAGFGNIIEYNNQATITLEQPGTLPQKISDFDKNLITHLKIKGKINGTDIKFIREMAGVSVTRKKTDGELTNLDLSEAQIVSGGDYYYQDYNDTKHYTSDDEIGVGFFSKCKGLKAITLPGKVKSVGESAFQECSCLETINLPSGITSIGNYAFLECENLKSVTLPSGLISIGDRAFYGCSNLANVTLSSNITSIGSSAFSDCKSLKNLTISKDVTSIKDIRFNNDYEDLELESVYVAWQNPIEAGSFFNRIKISNCTLYVPQGTKEAYANADVWKDFGNIIEYDATGIDKVTNRSDVKEISRYSLNGQRVTSPTKGVNIVIYSDGSIKKVAVQ